MKKRLLVLASTYPRWADDTQPGFVHELSKRLSDRFEVYVLCPHAPGAKYEEYYDGVKISRFRYAPDRYESLVQDGGILVSIKNKPWKILLIPLFLFSMTWKMRRLLRQLNPDIIHAHWIIPQGFVLLILGFITRNTLPPILITSHGSDLIALQSRLMSVLKCKILAKADKVTVVSRPMHELAMQLGVQASKLYVMPMGVDFVSRFTPGQHADRALGEVLFVGRLVEQKGLRYLIEAMPEVIDRHPNAQLTIVGDGPEKLPLLHKAEKLGVSEYIKFVGAVRQDALPAFYRRAALTAIPFIGQEGLGIVTIEAIACECPIIVSRIAPVFDLIDEKLDLDCLVAPADARELASIISTVLLDPEAHRIKASDRRRRLLKVYDWEVASNRYADLLETMARSGVSSRNAH